MPHFRCDGIDFYFEEHGSGRPLVFSHGLGGDLNGALELAAGIPNVHLIAYDNRGHGRTRPLGEPSALTFSRMADDMAALLDHLGIRRAAVGGVSMGAGIAAAFALRHTQRADALILSRPAWLDEPNPPNLAFAPIIAELLERGGREHALRGLRETRYYRDLEAQSPASARTLRDVLAGADPQALAACYRAIPASTPVAAISQLSGLNLRALVLGNLNDPFHPFEFAEAWAHALPSAELHRLPSKYEEPEEHLRLFRQSVKEFLARTPERKET
jgi:pimeloyl-ACP methyl ester carboxylesterase